MAPGRNDAARRATWFTHHCHFSSRDGASHLNVQHQEPIGNATFHILLNW
jgi:hypothetical protein